MLYLHELPDLVQRRAVADYLRSRWERTYPAGPSVARVELFNMVRPTAPPGSDVAGVPTIRPVLLFRADYARGPAATAVSHLTN